MTNEEIKNTIAANGGVDWNTANVDGIDPSDYPDFCDAHVSEMDYKNGKPMSDEALAYVSENDPDFVYEKVMEWLY